MSVRRKVLGALAVLGLVSAPSVAEALPASTGANGAIDAISCASAGNCTAVGHLAPPSQKVLFTVSEKGGVWSAAKAVPGLPALLGSKPSGALFTGISCPSAGNCGAVGSYSPSGSRTRAFVVSERNGVWGKLKQVTGLAAFTTDQYASVDSIDCPSAGNCSAGGSYAPRTFNHLANRQAFLVNEKKGAWGKALNIAGLAKLNSGSSSGIPGASFYQLSCSSAGNCLAAGSYDGKQGLDPFTVTEKHGTWGAARAFPRLIAASDGGHFAQIASVSCIVALDCTAVGFYFQSETDGSFFTFSQKNGVWGPIKAVGITELAGRIGSLTCVSTGRCAAGGNDIADLNAPDVTQPFVATEKNGAWSSQRLPGVAELSAATMDASISGVICRSAGNCSAAGTYDASDSQAGVYVSTEQKGVWSTAIELPGFAALVKNNRLGPPVLSCGAPGDCGLGGFYNSGGLSKPYLASQRDGVWGSAKEVKGVEP